MPVAFRAEPCVVAGDRRKAVVVECVLTSPLRGNPTIQKRFTGFMDYAAGGRYKTGGRKEKDFQDLQDFRAAGIKMRR